jgi:hypothetical protein
MVTTPDKYPWPNMQDLLNSLHGCNVFSTIDLVKDYHQIPVAAADTPKTVILTPFNLFEYLFTSFGLSNVAQTFQRMINSMIDSLEGVLAFMEDSCVGSTNSQTQLLHLDGFFISLATNGLTINLEKCIFAVPSLEILSHMIFAAGSAPTAGHVTEIESYPPPRTSSNCMQCFLCLVNF